MEERIFVKRTQYSLPGISCWKSRQQYRCSGCSGTFMSAEIDRQNVTVCEVVLQHGGMTNGGASFCPLNNHAVKLQSGRFISLCADGWKERERGKGRERVCVSAEGFLNGSSEPVLLLWVCNVLMCYVESKKRDTNTWCLSGRGVSSERHLQIVSNIRNTS